MPSELVKKAVSKNVKKKAPVAKSNKKVPAKNISGKAGTVQYKMSKECAQGLLSSRRGAEEKMSPQDFLCQYVDEQYGLLGHCVEVIIG